MTDNHTDAIKNINKSEKAGNKDGNINKKRSSWFNFGIFDKSEQDPAKLELLSNRDDPNEIEVLL